MGVVLASGGASDRSTRRRLRGRNSTGPSDRRWWRRRRAGPGSQELRRVTLSAGYKAVDALPHSAIRRRHQRRRVPSGAWTAEADLDGLPARPRVLLVVAVAASSSLPLLRSSHDSLANHRAPAATTAASRARPNACLLTRSRLWINTGRRVPLFCTRLISVPE